MSVEGLEGSPVLRLSDERARVVGRGPVLLMVGSFAPPHRGHVAGMAAARRALEADGEAVAGVAYTANSDSYVSTKVDNSTGLWDFDKRVGRFFGLLPSLDIPTFVDDISGSKPPTLTITETAVGNLAARLQIEPARMVVVVGSDQAASMEPHLADNRAVCVIRPGSITPILDLFKARWFQEAVSSGRYVLTDREDPFENVSSTQIRRALAAQAAGATNG